MPLFKCAKCGVVENTALSLCSWNYHFGGKKPLCSQCCPEQKCWHNRFKRTKRLPNGERDYFKSFKKHSES